MKLNLCQQRETQHQSNLVLVKQMNSTSKHDNLLSICSNGYTVSDHCPVMCIYEIGQGSYLSYVAQDFSGKNLVK